MRLDQFIVQQGLVSTRNRAQDAIKQGRVHVNGDCVQKNSYQVIDGDEVNVVEEEVALASRAGHKLWNVLDDFDIHLAGRTCIDVGASTGGFSDVCIKEGASLVYAVDVGRDQLLKELREHPRIVNMEGVNCRYLKRAMFDPLPDFACMDVSFISITLILPALFDVLSKKEAVVLIKPQFEAGKQYLNKHGIIRDKQVHLQVLTDCIQFVEAMGLHVHHVQASSLLGRDGNKEFVMHIKEEPSHRQFALKEIIKDNHSKR